MMLSIKEAAIKVELTPHTLRYYESEGLIPFLQRDEQGHRVYRKKISNGYSYLVPAQHGMSIREMKAL